MTRILFLFATTVFLASQTASANIVVKGAREIVEVIMKKGGKDVIEDLVEFGGKQSIQEALERASREGGDELVEKVIRYGKKYGVSAVKTIDNAPSLYVKALDELPENMIERALWAVQREPEKITRLLDNHGIEILQVVAKHRGVGTIIITKLGDDGVRLARELTEEQAIILARHADEIDRLPEKQRSQIIETILAAPARFIDYMENHPKVFLSATGIASFIALKDDLLGRHEEIVINPDGSRTLRKRGFIERQFEIFRKPISAIFIVIAFVIGGWGIVKIWGIIQKERIKIARDGFHFEQEKKEQHETEKQPSHKTP